MARGPLTFRQRDVTAAIKATENAGKQVFAVQVGKDGSIRLITSAALLPAIASAEVNEWDGADEAL